MVSGRIRTRRTMIESPSVMPGTGVALIHPYILAFSERSTVDFLIIERIRNYFGT
jgi:hypothetical protein